MEQDHYKRLCEEQGQHWEARLHKFRPYLVKPPADFVKMKMDIFQVDLQTVDSVLPLIICGLKRGLKRRIVLHPRKTIDLGIMEMDRYTHYSNPLSLDHAKELTGVPNAVHELHRTQPGSCECTSRWRPPMEDLRNLPSDKDFSFEQLGAPQRAALHRVAASLLYGYANPEVVTQSPYDRVVDYVIERVREIPTFVGNELIVCPDERVDFAGYAAVYFNNVIVVGNGEIHLGNNTKLHAYQIRHI